MVVFRKEYEFERGVRCPRQLVFFHLIECDFLSRASRFRCLAPVHTRVRPQTPRWPREDQSPNFVLNALLMFHFFWPILAAILCGRIF